jgi:CRP-like cAMP-binding protein
METTRKNAELEKLLLKGRHYRLTKGQVIQSTDDRRVFNLVKEGYVKRYLIANNGALGVQVVYGKGDTFPISLVLTELEGIDFYEGPEVFYYEAMCDTEIYTVDIDTLLAEVKHNPALYRDLLWVTTKRLHSTLNGLENITLRSSYKRVAHQLAFFANQFGHKQAKGTRIEVPLTHQDLADVLSVTRETVSAAFVELRKKGLIQTSKSIVVPDMQKLIEEAYA